MEQASEAYFGLVGHAVNHILLVAGSAAAGGIVLGMLIAKRFAVPYDADRYFPHTDPEEVLLKGALEMCNRIKDHTTRCFFKGRIREMIRLQPICDKDEFIKMSKDLHAEIDDCLQFGTCFRYAGPPLKFDKSRLPPGPLDGLATLQVAMKQKRLHRLFSQLAKKYGKIFPMTLPRNPMWVIISGAKEAKAVFHDNGITMSSRLFGQGHLITHTDFPAGNFLRCPFTEDLKKRRSVVWREALSKQKVALFRPILDRCRHISMRAFLLVAEKGEAFDPRPYLRMSYLNTLACILFGISFDDVEDPRYRRVYEFVDMEANEPLGGEADFEPLLRHTPIYTWKAERMKKIRRLQDEWLTEQIKVRIAHLKEGRAPQTFTDILLQTMDHPCPGNRLAFENIKEICNEIIFAGTDTTATTTETVLAHLLNNPDKAAELRKELDGIFVATGAMPCAEDYAKMPYLNSCIREAMRMTCAVPFNGHACSADTEVLGYTIPKGSICFNNIYAVHYDEEIYPDPWSYKPERWMGKDPCRWSVENDFEFMPFGIGRRLCIGYNLALENLQLFCASMFLSFDFASATGKPVSMEEEMDFTVSLPPFKVSATVREHTPLAKMREHFRSLPAFELTTLGSKDAGASKPSAAADGPVREKWAVWYGSQTGTAEGFANALAQAAKKRGVECAVRCLETAGKKDGGLVPDGESKAIFFVATFGNGEPTDNAVDFFDWLKKDSSKATGLHFAVFGLGNSEYEYFNGAGKYLDARLEQVGGVRLQGVPLGLGDALKDIDGDFDAWMRDLLDQHAPLEASAPAGRAPARAAAPGSAWQVLWVPEVQAKEKLFANKRQLTRRKTRISQLAETSTTGRVVAVGELAKQPRLAGSIVEVTIDLGEGATYDTADTIGIFPTNNKEYVELFGALLNQPLDSSFSLDPVDPDVTQDLPFACPTTLREVLSTVVDILGKPSKRLLGAIAEFCGDASEYEELTHLISPAGKAKWDQMASMKQLSLLDIFRRYRSLSAMPLGSFLELVPQMRLKPRYYTASSCPKAMGMEKVLLTVKVLRDRVLDTGDPSRTAALGGVTSTFLAEALAGDPVQVFVQPSAFSLPPDPATPVVMVGAGTGLAPFRGFLQERRLLLDADASLGEAMLFFGCTLEDADFICEEELKSHLKDGSLSQLVTAFSRKDPTKKVYVQHRLLEYAASVKRVIQDQEGHFYICGSTAMGRAVKDVLAQILAQSMPHADAEAFVADMEKRGRFIAELWA